MLDIIIKHPVEAIVVLVILIAIATLVYVNRKDVLLKSALYIVAKVEEEWGSNMGQVKFAEAYTYIKSKYPIVTFFLPESLMKEIIEDALVRLKEILASKEAKAKALAAAEQAE
jgi:hypothetical protein